MSENMQFGKKEWIHFDEHERQIDQLRAENLNLKDRRDELETWLLKSANGTGAEISNTERAVSSSQIERLSDMITDLRAEIEALKQHNKEMREALEKIKQEASRPLNGQSTRAMRILDYAEAAIKDSLTAQKEKQ